MSVRSVSDNFLSTQQFTISGEIEDGPLGAETGVQTDVRLIWNPIATPNIQVLTQESQVGTGAFNFTTLLGEAGHFIARVDGGVNLSSSFLSVHEQKFKK